MDKLTTILVVANRTEADRVLMRKAVLLARSVGARIHLFSCDAPLAKILHHAYSCEEGEKAWQICLGEHLAYLQGLKASMRAPDVQISVDASCYSPLYEGVLQQAAEIRPDLIMKSPSGVHPVQRFSFDANDWHLMRSCPAALMLVRSHPWRSLPKLAALVDVSEEGTERLNENIVHTAEYFALGCRGELDVVYSERSADIELQKSRAEQFARLAHEYRIAASRRHVLGGDPDLTLPEFVAHQQYDAIVMGALTHRRGIASLGGTLTSGLVDALDCDFILVKRSGYERPALTVSSARPDLKSASSLDRALPPRPAAIGSSAFWQSLLGR